MSLAENIRKELEAQMAQPDFEWFDFDKIDSLEGMNDDVYVYTWLETIMDIGEAFETVLNDVCTHKVSDIKSFYVNNEDLSVFVLIVQTAK